MVKVFGKGQKERLVPISLDLRRRIYRYQQLRNRRLKRDRLKAMIRDAGVA